MIIPIAVLLQQPTQDKIASWILTLLGKVGFPTSAWQTTSVPRRLIYAFSGALADLGPNVANIVASGFRTLATGPWLDLIASDFYGLTRDPATFTIGSMTLSNASAATYTINVGDLVSSSTTGLLYRNTTSGTLTPGGTLTLTWQAESPGASYSVGGETITSLVTPLSGVTVSALSGIAWITTQGTDEESDVDLSTRCGEQWSTLGAAGSTDAYVYNCKLASAEVTRVRVYEATPSPGYVTCYLAGPAGPVTLTTANSVRTWFETNGRRPLCVGLYIYPASTHTITVTGTVQVTAGKLAAAQAAIATAFESIAQTTDFGGLVDYAEVLSAVRMATGVTHVALTAPVADVQLASSEIAVLVDSLTYVEV